MKKLFTFFSVLFLPVCLIAGQYVSLQVGPDYCYRTDDNDHGQKVGYKVGGSYGYKFINGIRGEVELAYRNGHKRTVYVYSDGGADSKTHVSGHSMSYMANFLYDVGGLSTYGIVPYLGAGVGLCSNTYNLKTQKNDSVTNRDHGKDDRFAWQAIVGAKYPIADQLDMGLEYKYFCGQYHAKNHSISAVLVRSF